MESDVETVKGLISAWIQAVNTNDTDRILGLVATCVAIGLAALFMSTPLAA